MEIHEKAFARQKFRSSRGRGRGGRGGGAHRGGHYGGPARPAPRDLDSNAFRYEDEAEAEDGTVAPKSQGADLEALIEDADVQFNQAFYRFRTQLHDIAEEVPPLGATQPEQLLAIDLEALSASLSALPLHALLGLEPHYLEGVEVTGSESGRSSGPQSHGSAAAGAGLTAPGQRPHGGTAGTAASMTSAQVQPAGITHQPSPLRPEVGLLPHPEVQRAPVAAAVTSSYMPAAVPQAPPTAAAAPLVPGPPGSVSFPTSARAGAIAVSVSAGSAPDVDDEELEALLTGHAAPLRSARQPVVSQPGATETRPTGPHVLPAALAAAMAAARPPLRPAGLPSQFPAPCSLTPHTTAQPGQGGQGSSIAGAVGAGQTSVPTHQTGAAAASSGISQIRASLPAYSPYGSEAAGTGLTSPALGTGGGAGVVRLAPAGSAAPLATVAVTHGSAAVRVATHGSVVSPTNAVATLASAGQGASARLVEGPPAPASAVPKPGGVGSTGSSLVPPPLVRRQPTAPGAPAGGAVGGGGGSRGAVVDEELRLLLGLPATTGGPSNTTSAAGASAAVNKAVQSRPGLQPAAAVSLPPAAAGRLPPPAVQQHQQHQQQSKSLDDWLDGL